MIEPDSNRPSVEAVLHGALATVCAVAVAVMAIWPQVQTLVV